MKSQNNRGESKPDLIIKGGTVLTMAKGQSPLHDATVLISGGKIIDVLDADHRGKRPEAGTEIIDARDAIVMPGMINCHTHLAMTLFRGIADDLPLKKWLFEKIFPLEAKVLNPETVYWGSLLGCLELIASGTTCFADGYFFEEATLKAVQKAGLRSLLSQGVIDFAAPGVDDPRKNLIHARSFIERYSGLSKLIRPGIFCHSALTCSGSTLQDAWEISREFGVPFQIHLSETKEEVDEIMVKSVQRPVFYLDQLGILDQNLIAAHSIYLDKDEINCLKQRDVKVVHVPESNMKLGCGIAKISEMICIGLQPGLGTDGCSSNNNLDLFQEMDSAAKLSKVAELDPVALSAKNVLKMATIWGAGILGLQDQIGSIEKGKQADIIVIDLNSPHLCPIYDPASILVYSANGSDVKDVIVNGKILMKDRCFMTLDPAQIMAKVKDLSTKIIGAQGAPVHKSKRAAIRL